MGVLVGAGVCDAAGEGSAVSVLAGLGRSVGVGSALGAAQALNIINAQISPKGLE